MTSSDLLWIGVAVATLMWIMYRQITWQPVIGRRMWMLPVVLGGFGIYTLYTTVGSMTGPEIGVAVLELTVAAGTGAAMGRIARFRPLSDASSARLAVARRPSAGPVATESRTGWWGLALWLVAIMLRAAVAAIGLQLGAALVASVGMIYLSLAANRAARTGVLLWRLDRSRSA